MAFYGKAGYWMKHRKDAWRADNHTIPSSVFLPGSVLPAYFFQGKKWFSQIMNS
jgi:hypothetical protein